MDDRGTGHCTLVFDRVGKDVTITTQSIIQGGQYYQKAWEEAQNEEIKGFQTTETGHQEQ
jgi:hypothetical protein